MKILFISHNLLAPDLLLRLKKEGHSVFLAVKEKSKILDGSIKKIPFEKRMDYLDKADLIVYDDVKFGNEPADLRAKGYLVIGGSNKSDTMELNRIKGAKIAELSGIKAPKSQSFSSIAEIITFVKNNPHRWVLKQEGELDGIKGLNFVSKVDNCRDLISYLEWLETKWVKGLEQTFVLQEFIEGHEFACGAYWNGTEFMKDKDGNEICEENFEHKALMPGDLGTATGEMFCYDEQTEVLTKNGWKFWKDIIKEDEMATLIDGKLKYEIPSELTKFDYKGEMIGWQNRSIDVLVTPNHWMYVNGQSPSRNGKDKFEFRQAKDCNGSQYSIKRTAEDWDGFNDDYYILKGREKIKGKRVRTCEDVKIKMDDFASFLGIYFSEGHSDGKTINIAQSYPQKMEKVESILSKLPFGYKKAENGFLIHNTQLAKELKQFGLSYEKYVPDYIKNASKKVIDNFIEGYVIGDGSVLESGSRVIFTTSKRMADDLQELMLKTGKLGVIKEKSLDYLLKYKERKIDGRIITPKRAIYLIFERTKKIRSWLDKRDKYTKQYDGKVYCATVSSHLLFVRRNGLPIWCGNTLMRYKKAKESKLFLETLDKMRDILKKIDFRGDIDANCIINKDGVHFLEWTMRFGSPATDGQEAIHQSPWGDFLKAVADGKQTNFEYNPDWTIVSWIFSPPFPNYLRIQDIKDKNSENIEQKKELLQNELMNAEGLEVDFKEELSKNELNNVHLEGVYLENNKIKLADCSGCVFTITGQGKTPKEAGENAENLLKKMLVPKGFWRNDFTSHYDKSKDNLIEWGYLEKEKNVIINKIKTMSEEQEKKVDKLKEKIQNLIFEEVQRANEEYKQTLLDLDRKKIQEDYNNQLEKVKQKHQTELKEIKQTIKEIIYEN